jgi:hypothetical protein
MDEIACDSLDDSFTGLANYSTVIVGQLPFRWQRGQHSAATLLPTGRAISEILNSVTSPCIESLAICKQPFGEAHSPNSFLYQLV